MQPLTVVEMLGSLSIRQADHLVVRFATHRAATLLAYISLFRRHAHAREELTELLWPAVDVDVGRHRLRQALTSLRRQLEPPGVDHGSVLVADRSHVHLNADAAATDVERFEAAVHAARAGDTPAQLRRLLEEAAALYRGELLPGWYDDWVITQRERLAESFITVCCTLALLDARQGARSQALERIYQALAVDPLNEEARLIRRRLQAHAVRDDYVRTDVDTELAAENPIGRSPREAHKATNTPYVAAERVTGAPGQPTLTDDAKECAAGRESDAAALPVFATRFFGRREELDSLCSLLRNETRLVTLTGFGGCGKTRLAVEAARFLDAACPGSVGFISLSEVENASLIPETVARAMGIQPSPDARAMDQIAARLARRAQQSVGGAILVLDNFEHLLDRGPACVAELLARVPPLRVLVTSRRALHLADEWEIVVPPLPIPSGTISPERLFAFPCVGMFVERMQAKRPDFQVTPANAEAVAELCARLEGIPLAIELAAGWARTLTPAQMVGQLDHGLDLLSRPQADPNDRHASIRQTIERNFDLLQTEHRCLLARLSVFSDGWTLEAAAAVCGDAEEAQSRGGESAMLSGLRNLLDHALIQAHEHGSAMRFHMLETLRECARRQLTPDEEAGLARRHADYYMALAERHDVAHPAQPDDLTVEVIAAEEANLQSALDWSIRTCEAEIAMRLAAALRHHWAAQKRSQWGREMLSRALAISDGARTVGRARALLGLGTLCASDADPTAARAPLEESVRIARALPDGPCLLHAMTALARAHWNLRDIGAAERCWREALASCDAGESPETTLEALMGLARVAMHRGDFAQARSHQETCLRMVRPSGSPGHLLAVLLDTGITAWFQGHYPEAQAYLEESQALCRQTGNRSDAIRALLGLGNVARAQGDLHTARALYQECLQSVHEVSQSVGEVGQTIQQAYCLEAFAHLAFATDEHGQAARLLASAALVREGIATPPLLSVEAHELDRLKNAVQLALGEAGFRKEWAAGRILGPDRAADLVMNGGSPGIRG